MIKEGKVKTNINGPPTTPRPEPPRSQIAPMQLCEHYACRCARAEELSQIADRIESTTGVTVYSNRLRLDAVDVHEQLVRCRMSA